MKRLNKKKVVYLIILAGMFSLGMLSQYAMQNSDADKTITQLKNEIKQSQENNKQLEREIVNLHKEIEQYQIEQASKNDEHSTNSSLNQSGTSESTETVEKEIAEEDGNEEEPVQEETNPPITNQDTSQEEKKDSMEDFGDQSTENIAINLTKDYIGYSNEPNVHFESQGKVPGTDDLLIQVYEIVVDEGEGQHTATWGWYGVNVNTGKVYEANN